MEKDEIDWRIARREPLKGLAFLLSDSVEVVTGLHRGTTGSVVAVREMTPEPIYVVRLAAGQNVHLNQSEIVGTGAAGDLGDLQRWYSAQCDGDWEHSYGVEIGTLDNPGWSVDVELTGTDLVNVPFDEINQTESDREWLNCRVRERRFEGRGGPHMLGVIIRVFLQWASVRR